MRINIFSRLCAIRAVVARIGIAPDRRGWYHDGRICFALWLDAKSGKSLNPSSEEIPSSPVFAVQNAYCYEVE
ncbi:MAG: hypothetical protein ABIF19_04535 [Planctomycetota bacterium]